ncbi:hypothetical protein IMCC3317_41020 [Kordia antarctica]|uniref:Uncharacterized protein n=1 Tax=Kordia antarctica TaxID=1218801 RepID=A0A7L4ZPP4_9FLAO|nr:hypothetical protein [Kordia antarctica]QHI38708.1 hypothetical protein IMCC3317_41020 [Kordia antarctica]
MEIGKYKTALVNKSKIDNIFGILLYSNSNPFLVKVIKDEDFWNSLHTNSGTKFPIFALKPKLGYYSLPNQNNHTLYHLIPIWKEPSENQELLKELGIPDTKKLPLLVICTEVNKTYLSCAYEIKGDSINSVFNSLNKFCKIINDTVEKFDEKNLKNNESLFREISKNFEYYVAWNELNKGYGMFKKIRSFFKLF